jgi:hypothetical protein
MIRHISIVPLILSNVFATVTFAATFRVPLTVVEGLGQSRHEIVTAGVPLKKGALTEPEQARLLDASGRVLPAYASCCSRWPDGSVKWLLIHCPVDLAGGATAHWTLAAGGPPARPGDRVRVEDGADGVVVTTGPMRFRIGKKGFRFLEQVAIDSNHDGRFDAGEELLRPGAGGSWMDLEHASPHAPQEENWLWDAAGGPRERFSAAPDARDYHVTVEEAGPARAVVAVRGYYRNGPGRKVAPFWVRYTAGAGEAKIVVEHFFAFDGDPQTDFLRALALRLPLKTSSPLATTFGIRGNGRFAVPAGFQEAALFEVVPDRFYTCVPYTADRAVPYRIEGSKAGPKAASPAGDAASTVLHQGVEAGGWVHLEGEGIHLTLAMRDFWQLHPKELRIAPATGDLDIYLWPERGNKVLDLRRRYKDHDDAGHYDLGWYPDEGRGVGKTHELVLDFSGAPPLQTWASAQEPLRAFASPQHYADTGLWGPFATCDPQRFPRWEARMDAGMEWLLRLPSVFHWDGMIDWGDTLFNGYEVAGHDQVKDVPKGSWVLRGYDGWMNNECSFAGAVLLYFLRTGDLRVWRRFERMTQHVMDVDTVHCASNRRVIGGGHRHDEQHWGNYVTGYGTAAEEASQLYFFTGRQSAREMAVKYADWYLDGDWCEWENRIGCLVWAWEVTGDPRYLKALAPEALEQDTYVKSLHRPFFRSHATILGLAHYAAVVPNDWAQTVLRRAARRMIDEDMGNGSGLNLLAIACAQTNDADLRQWLRRFLASHDPYGTPVVDAFDYKKLMPGRAAEVDFEVLQQLVRYPGFGVQNPFGLVSNVLTQYPYAMRALGDGGLTEADRYLADSVYRRKGWGWEWGMRGPKVAPLPGCHFEPIAMDAVANRNPLADPFEEKDRQPCPALRPGDLGFQFEESGPPLRGFLPVRWGTLYPRRVHFPMPSEHDDRNLCGLPFGTMFQCNGIPFDLPDPRRSADGKTILVLQDNQRAVIPAAKTVRRLHFLGHVGRRLSTVQEIGARYRIRYADGTEQAVDLVNMVHFEHVLYWGFSKQARFARNWKLHGGWDGEPFLLHTFTLEAEDRPIREIVVEDGGNHFGFVLLAVTAEVAGEHSPPPLRTVRFGAGEQGAAKNLWKAGGGGGWTDLELELGQGDRQVFSHGRATYRLAVPNGDYDLELEMAGHGGMLGVDVIVGGQLRVKGYCPTHQPAPGSDGFTEVVRFPVRVTDGLLDVALANDAGAGTWFHPAPIRDSRWALWTLNLYPGSRQAPPPLPEIPYGWAERDLQWLPSPWHIEQEATNELARTCLRSRSSRGTFRVDLPPGQYDLDLIVGFRGDRQQGQVPDMNVRLQGHPVLQRFASPPARLAQTLRFPATVKAGQPLELVFSPASRGAEWGINALIVRRAKVLVGRCAGQAVTAGGVDAIESRATEHVPAPAPRR